MSHKQLPLQRPLLARLWGESQTKLWAYTQMLMGPFVYGLHELVTNPDIKEALTPFHIDPGVWLILTVLGIVTFCAHGHNQDA
jgi:hypothetical protein